ncbi:MAG: flagellar export protein FliJ [Gammaproteobacteria bacterium]|nr:flagellar export protein FliJ [Gammaproteobacteria bacterium]
MKSKRFEPIQEIAADAAAVLGRGVAEAERRLAELERQLERLRAYREEYTRASAAKGGAVDAVSLQNYRSFLDRLGDAMRVQAQQIGVARAECEARRAQWISKRVEAESLSRAIDRFRRDERQVAERREQRDGDEAAMRLAMATGGALRNR